MLDNVKVFAFGIDISRIRRICRKSHPIYPAAHATGFYFARFAYYILVYYYL